MTTSPISPVAATPEAARAFASVPASAIVPSRTNPRTVFDEAYIASLAESIRLHGLLQPIALRAIADGAEPSHELIMGECRWRACRLVDPAYPMPAVVFAGVTSEQARELALVENLHRRDLDPIDEAQGYAGLREMGYTQERIAERVGRTRARVANTMRLLTLPAEVQGWIRAGELTQAHGEALLRYKDFPPVLRELAATARARGDGCAVLEAKGLPYASELEQAGVIVRIDYDTLAAAGLTNSAGEIWDELRKQPWVRVLKPQQPWDDEDFFALDPEQWSAFVAARVAADRAPKKKGAGAGAEVEAASEREPAADAPCLVKLDTVPHGERVLLADLDARVRAKIPEEAVELGYFSHTPERTVEFTREVKLVHSLERAASAAKNKRRRAELDAALEQATEALAAVREVRVEDLATLFTWSLQHMGGRRAAQVGAAAEALAIEYERTGEVEDMAAADIVRLCLLARLRGEWSAARATAAAMPEDLARYGKGWEKRLRASDTDEKPESPLKKKRRKAAPKKRGGATTKSIPDPAGASSARWRPAAPCDGRPGE